MNEDIRKELNWTTKEIINVIIGCIIFSFAINVFIVPSRLYSGGMLGVSQLIRSLIQGVFHFKAPFDFSGLLYFLINAPLLLVTYRMLSKQFFRRTLLCIMLQSILLLIIPIPENPILPDTLSTVLIGGICAGFGVGMILSNAGSLGGSNIIAISLMKKYDNLTIGKVDLTINLFVFLISGLVYGLDVMIYSIIFAGISSVAIDRFHDQNVCSSAMIITKNDPKKLIDFIRKEVGRDCSYWKGKGAYKDDDINIIYTILSRYEFAKLERNIDKLDKHAFMIYDEGMHVKGNYKKNIIKEDE